MSVGRIEAHLLFFLIHRLPFQCFEGLQFLVSFLHLAEPLVQAEQKVVGLLLIGIGGDNSPKSFDCLFGITVGSVNLGEIEPRLGWRLSA